MAREMRIDWWLAGICASRVFNGLVFMTYAAALPVLQREWEMSAAAAGSIASGFQIGYAVSLVVFSSLADRFSPKRLYLWSMLAAGLCSMGFALFARDHFSGLVLYCLVGISLGGTYTTGMMIISHQYPVRRRGMALGFFIASTSLGYALSLGLSGLALPVGGYRLSFLLTCLGPVMGWIAAWATLRGTQVPPPGPKDGRRFTRAVLGNRPAMLLIGGYAFHSWELLGMWAWAPAFVSSCLASIGTGTVKAAGLGSFIAASFHVTGLMASFSMGALSDRLGRARVILLMSGASAVCSFVFGWTIGWPLAIVVVTGLMYAFFALGDSPVLSAGLTEVIDVSYMGAAFGLRSLLGFGAGSISPLVFGLILDWSNPLAEGKGVYETWGWAFGALGLGGLAAFLCGLQLGRMGGRRDDRSG